MSNLGGVSITFAFAAGLVSFLSPCVLPIIPGFLAYLAGATLQESGTKRWSIFLNSLFFVLGFAAVFSLIGVILNSILVAVAYDAQLWLARIGGVLIIFFGLYLTGLISIPFLQKEYKFSVRTRFASRLFTSFVFGAAFAAGWTPCVGAVLGAILGLAATSPGLAFILLFSYSLGLGLPFLIVGLFTSQAAAWISKFSSTLDYINKIFGLFLIILGILIFTQNLSQIASLQILNKWLLK